MTLKDRVDHLADLERKYIHTNSHQILTQPVDQPDRRRDLRTCSLRQPHLTINITRNLLQVTVYQLRISLRDLKALRTNTTANLLTRKDTRCHRLAMVLWDNTRRNT
jgi:hypothetical protein